MKIDIGVDDALVLIHSIDTTTLCRPANCCMGTSSESSVMRVILGFRNEMSISIANMSRVLSPSAPGAGRRWIKASARAKVEHPFRYIKQVFGYDKVRYRGLARNTIRLHLLAAFSNRLHS